MSPRRRRPLDPPLIGRVVLPNAPPTVDEPSRQAWVGWIGAWLLGTAAVVALGGQVHPLVTERAQVTVVRSGDDPGGQVSDDTVRLPASLAPPP